MSRHEGSVGWLISGATALTFDLLNEQSMSSYAREKFREHPAVGLGVLALSAFHLTRPDSLEKFDPISQVANTIDVVNSLRKVVIRS